MVSIGRVSSKHMTRLSLFWFHIVFVHCELFVSELIAAKKIWMKDICSLIGREYVEQMREVWLGKLFTHEWHVSHLVLWLKLSWLREGGRNWLLAGWLPGLFTHCKNFNHSCGKLPFILHPYCIIPPLILFIQYCYIWYSFNMANANPPIPATNYSSDKQSNSTSANTSAAVVGDYLVRSKIGQGSFATVFKAVHKVNSPISNG